MKSFYVGIKAIIEHDNKFLLLKKSLKESKLQYYWDVPGGRIEGEERIEEALKRELEEEIGYQGAFEIVKLLDVYKLPFTIENQHGLLLVFYKITAAVSSVTLSNEHESYSWFSRDELKMLIQKDEERIVRGGVKGALDEILSQR